MTASGRKLNVEAPLAAKACLVGVSPTGTQMRIAGSCGLCWSEGIARPSLVTSRQANRTEGDCPTVRLTACQALPRSTRDTTLAGHGIAASGHGLIETEASAVRQPQRSFRVCTRNNCFPAHADDRHSIVIGR